LVESADFGSTIALNNNIDNTDFNTNTAITSAFDINTSGGLSPSFSPPTIAQGVENSAGLTSLEKIIKLKSQWLDLLP
jgi:hypothetical protein